MSAPVTKTSSLDYGDSDFDDDGDDERSGSRLTSDFEEDLHVRPHYIGR